ncbi:hypothetical protein BLNAU_21097 [Blattamonas nauphoetae]|uniref:Uncharacterized protein n=1 Tax=Blattamonas nauphoetae TaxID=2049346 RepID=A0ABQ9WXG3_9EUKA|nr:hypothetical protein BLNAU_21097 [Blattamonas nauphoetae]
MYQRSVHEILKFIEHFFKSGGPKERPGHAFYIAGDQGIGKTSLMLILMSTLSLRSIDFHYEKGFKYDPKRLPPPEKKDDTSHNDQPITIPSSDAKILPPEKQPQPSTTQTQAQASSSPEPSSNHPCHIFRLPTFSLAEDAVAMVGCTPIVSFAVLSPEDMQLHTKDQQILLSIEMDKDEIAGRLPRAFVDNILSSKNSTVAKELKNLVGDKRVSLTQWKKFCRKIEEEIASRQNGGGNPKPSPKSIQTGGKGKLSKLSPKNTPTRVISQTEYAQIVARQQEEELMQDYEAFIQKEEEEKQKEEDNLNINQDKQTGPANQQTDHFNQTPPPFIPVSPVTPQPDHFNQTPPPINQPGHVTLQTDVTASTVTDSNEEPAPSGLSSKEIDAIGTAYMKPKSEKDTVDEEIDRFYTSLNERIQNQKEIPDRERIIAVVDWLMNQLRVHSKRSQEQAEFIKGLIRKLVLFEWDQSEQQDQDVQNTEATTTAQNTQNEGGEGETDLKDPNIPLLGTLFEEQSEDIDLEKAEAATNGHKDQEEKGNNIVHKIPKTAEEHERERQRVITEKLFEIAKSYDPPAPNVIGEIQEFSVLIEKVKIANPQTSPSPKDLTDLTAQLVRLKTLIEGPNVSEDANRQNVRDAVTSVSKQDRLKDKKRRTLLFSTLIDMLITPPPYDSRKKVLQSLFVHPKEDVNTSDITNPKISAPIKLAFNKTKMASLACDFLMMIVNPLFMYPAPKTEDFSLNPETPPHIQVEQRLEYVQNQIEQVQVELSLVSLMDEFYFIAQDMNILVTPHSILRGLSERQEKPELDLIRERVVVYYGNVRDDGLRGWIENAIKTLLPLINTVGPLEAVSSKIKDNLNQVITQFNNTYQPSECSVINRQWLAIVRSVMNTILYLIDAGAPRCEILEKFSGLRQLLTTAYMSNQDHLLRVADQRLIQNCEEPKTDYVNDLTVFFAHFGTSESQAPDGDCSEMSPDLDLESLRTLELPRTLQLAPLSQDRLERMSIALFARNLLCFLQLETGYPFDDKCYLTEFYTEFLQKWNPGDIVHRSFVDFMNATNLLSQKNFRVTPDKFTDFLEEEHPTLKTDPTPLQKLREKSHLKSMMTERITLQVADPEQPFKNFLTRQFGVHFLLWASTDLLLKAANAIPSPKPRTETKHSQDEARPSEELEDLKTVHCLNVARASIFGPSPRWLTSTDARTNRGLVYLWDGVLRSERINVLRTRVNSDHSRHMEFNTERFFFENSMDAAWDDITAPVPLLPASTKENMHPTHLTAAYSLMVKKTAATLKKMKSTIPFVAVSPFVELILQSEVVSAIANMNSQAEYDEFRQNQFAKHIDNLPECLEEPLVCISFLLNCPTPISFCETTTSFSTRHTPVPKPTLFSRRFPCYETRTNQATTVPMLTFPKLSNKSVHGTTFPQTLSETKRGRTDFYPKGLLDLDASLPGIDALIVSRGSDAACETIFMAIQATSSISRFMIVQIQQLLFQAMCHLEASEEIVALFNSATTQMEPIFPSQTGILGFHMVSSSLKFDENTLTHLSSILRHYARPLATKPTESQTMMTTHDITNTVLANLPQYPTFSEKKNPWKTTLSFMNNRDDQSFILPFRWKLFSDDLRKSSPALFAQDGMVLRTIQELHRVGVCPNDLGETENIRKETFSSFLLCTAISCRRNELLNPTTTSDSREDDNSFVKLVESIVGTLDIQSMKHPLTSLTGQISTMTKSMRVEHLEHLGDLCRENCIQTRVHPVCRVMTNNAMKRMRNPAQEYLSVIQSEEDGGVFRVPTRNNLSAILHCGTVLLDNIPPLSPTISAHPPRSRTFRIPLHSFVLAKYGFSNSIPSLCELTRYQVRNEVTDVTPSPLIRWHPRRVVIDPSLFPSNIQQADSMPFFTTFIHRLFDDPFIPVSTSLSTAIPDNHSITFLFSQIQKITNILNSVDLSDKPKLKEAVDILSTLEQPKPPNVVFSLLSEVRSSLEGFDLSSDQRDVILPAIESIEAIQQQPTLVFVKSGSDLFAPSTEDPEFVVDTKTKAHLFPIPFSTGYKEGELREEMKLIYESLTDLLPDHFPKEHVSLSPPQDGQNKEQRDLSPSRTETERKSRAIMDTAILRMGETSTTPLFVEALQMFCGSCS